MKKVSVSIFLILLISSSLFSQTYNGNAYKKKVRPTKNVILMIPDGTSIGVVSAARWYQIYNRLGGENLYIDPYICGTVKTFSSNAPIPDSAPAISCYMTGIPSQTGNIAMYPLADKENDLVEIDSTMAYQPLATVLEAACMEQKKSTGLVVTVEFPHATPAGCAAHHHDRNRYDLIASQMAYQNLDVMFGGGVRYVSEDMKNHFKQKDIAYYADDISAFRNHDEGKIWALWCDKIMPYDIDRDTTLIPSLQEMTKKAIDLLSRNENGFFLMVEGSKVDWAAHSNDAAGCITEYLAFDKAVGAALEFAEKDGNTSVIILPDHGNSGFSIGRRDLSNYDKAGISKLFDNVSKYKLTTNGLREILSNEKPENLHSVIKKYTDIDIEGEEFKDLIATKNLNPENYMAVNYSKNIIATLTEIMNKRTCFGFTSGGHTGEEVFLAAYHPQGDIPLGMNTNIEICRYLSDACGLQKRLPELTNEIFAKHTDVFAGYTYNFNKSDNFPVLTVKKGKKILEIPASKSVVYLNKKPYDIGSVVVYMEKTQTFYLPRNLTQLLESSNP